MVQQNVVDSEIDYDFDYDEEGNHSKVILNVDCGLFDVKLSKFIDANHNRTIHKYKFEKTWIPTEDIPNLVDALSQDFVVHSLQKVLYFFNDRVLCNFRQGAFGLDEGVIYYTNKEDLAAIIDVIKNSANTSHKLDIRWITDANGNYYNMVELMNDVVLDSLYPFIEGGVNAYIKDFLDSKSSILILIGSPGLGKSGLIREIIARTNKRAYMTYNEAVFKDDDAFGDFVSSTDAGVFVIEDADMLLKSRDSGNELMAKFLGIGDGIIKLHGKKLIFSTNLPSTNDIDPAIMRAGRCYDVLNFRHLALKEAQLVCKEYGLAEVTEDRNYTLTELFNRKVIKQRRGMGFV
jgi:hypothetical protein